MSTSLVLACFCWAVVANVAGRWTPSSDQHWRPGLCVIAVGIPYWAMSPWQHGPWVGELVFAGGCSVLRWPVDYLMRGCAVLQ